ELEKCEEVLESFNAGQPVQYSTYETRWAALTRAKLLFRRGEFENALEWLDSLKKQPTEIDDHTFEAAVHLFSAQIYGRIGQSSECARHILQADGLGVGRNRDLQGQYNYSIGQIVSARLSDFGARLEERGTRIWSSQGNVSLRLELEGPVRSQTDRSPAKPKRTRDDDIRSVVNGLGAVFDVAYNPRLLGAELVNILSFLRFV